LISVSITNLEGETIEFSLENLIVSKDNTVRISNIELHQLEGSLVYIRVIIKGFDGKTYSETQPLIISK